VTKCRILLSYRSNVPPWTARILDPTAFGCIAPKPRLEAALSPPTEEKKHDTAAGRSLGVRTTPTTRLPYRSLRVEILPDCLNRPFLCITFGAFCFLPELGG
jgi:hypothetical protein